MFETIKKFHSDAAVIALRGLANSLLSRAIFLAASIIRNDSRANDLNKVDDEFVKQYGGEAVLSALTNEGRDAEGTAEHQQSLSDISNIVAASQGREPRKSAKKLLSEIIALRNYVLVDLETLVQSPRDRAMTPLAMFDFLCQKGNPFSRDELEGLKLLQAATGMDTMLMAELSREAQNRAKDQLAELRKEIVPMIVGDNGCFDSIGELGHIEEYKLAVKLVECMRKGWERQLNSMITRRQYTNVAILSLIEDAGRQAIEHVRELEKTYAQEISIALEVNPMLADVDTVLHGFDKFGPKPKLAKAA